MIYIRANAELVCFGAGQVLKVGRSQDGKAWRLSLLGLGNDARVLYTGSSEECLLRLDAVESHIETRDLVCDLELAAAHHVRRGVDA